MILCKKCGNSMREGDSFCNACGTPVNSVVTSDFSEKRSSFYDGEIHKCPNCGKMLDAFVAKCPECGYEVRGAKVAQSVTQFVNSLSTVSNIDEKINLILNYPIPPVKEDIIEFMFKTRTNLRAEEDPALFESWSKKFEEAYEKAAFMFSADADFEKLQKMYTETEAEIKKKRKKKKSADALAKFTKSREKAADRRHELKRAKLTNTNTNSNYSSTYNSNSNSNQRSFLNYWDDESETKYYYTESNTFGKLCGLCLWSGIATIARIASLGNAVIIAQLIYLAILLVGRKVLPLLISETGKFRKVVFVVNGWSLLILSFISMIIHLTLGDALLNFVIDMISMLMMLNSISHIMKIK